jgi:cyanophycinase
MPLQRPGRFGRALVSGIIVLGLSACRSFDGAPRGELVIVGGGLDADNAEVIEAFVDGAGERIVVLPTASGVPHESGPNAVEDLERHSDGGQSFDVLEVTIATADRASSRVYVEVIEEAHAVWFTGGDQSRITTVFRPRGIDTPAQDALERLLERGGRVAGSSAGAAIMSDPMISGGTSRDALLHGRGERGFDLERGLGFFPYGIVDQHFLKRGRIGRLIVALEESERALGFGIADDRALAVDLGTNTGRPLGERAVVVVDVAGMERDGRSRTDVRIALVSSGDTIDLETGAVAFADDKAELLPLDLPYDAQFDRLDPFGEDTLTLLLERLSSDPSLPQRASRGGIELVLSADEHTRFAARNGALEGFSARGVRLDVLVDASAGQPTSRRGRR